jgi:hypothetical protein
MDYIGSEVERKKIAVSLTKDIRLANLLAKHADSPRRRRNLYGLKHRKLSLGVTHFAEFFKIVSVEFSAGSLLVLIQLADQKSNAHCPWDGLTPAAQAQIRSMLTARLNTNPGLPVAA